MKTSLLPRGPFEPPTVKPGEQDTALTPEEEKAFQIYAKAARARGEGVWAGPAEEGDYDDRGAWKAGDVGTVKSEYDGKPHGTDRWKKSNHSSFSHASRYATENAPQWTQDGRLIDQFGNVVADERVSPHNMLEGIQAPERQSLIDNPDAQVLTAIKSDPSARSVKDPKPVPTFGVPSTQQPLNVSLSDHIDGWNPLLSRIRTVQTGNWNQDPGLTGGQITPTTPVAPVPPQDPNLYDYQPGSFYTAEDNRAQPIVAGRLILPTDLSQQFGVPPPETPTQFGSGPEYELYDDGTWYDYANRTTAPTPRPAASPAVDPGPVPPVRSRVAL